MRYLNSAVLVAAGLLTVACPKAPSYCKTACGLSLGDPGECAPLQEQEDFALNLYDQRGLFPRAPSCTALSGFTLYVEDGDDAGGFTDPWGRRVGGYTDCEAGEIHVGNERWHSRTNALSHEMIHAIQGCYCDGGDCHYQWRERGYYDAIEAARPEP